LGKRTLNILRRIIIEEKGSVAALIAIFMIVLLGSCALAIDQGLIYINRMKMIHALDSAVMAGAQELPGDPIAAETVARDYAYMNGLNADEVSFSVAADKKSISGTATREVELSFSKVMDLHTASVHVASKAKIAPISSAMGVVPFGILEDDYALGELVVLKEGSDDKLYPGWFGALRLGGNGADVYRNNVMYGYQAEVSIGEVDALEVEIEPGNMWGPTRDGVLYRIGECQHSPACTVNSFVKGCPRICIVPIVNIESTNPAGKPITVRVVGFAAFFLENFVGNDGSNEILGRFVNYVIPGKTNENLNSYGLYGVKLCE